MINSSLCNNQNFHLYPLVNRFIMYWIAKINTSFSKIISHYTTSSNYNVITNINAVSYHRLTTNKAVISNPAISINHYPR